MNQKRIIHSGCSLGKNLYVYGGCTMTNKGPHFYSSVEIFNAHAFLNNQSAVWQLIKISSKTNFVPRASHLMAPLNN